jgi:hypothetical protein
VGIRVAWNVRCDQRSKFRRSAESCPPQFLSRMVSKGTWWGGAEVQSHNMCGATWFECDLIEQTWK